MFFLKNSQVTFKRGLKPRSIKSAQKEVRQVYEALCEAGAPRVDNIARVKFYESLTKQHGVTIEQLSQASPAFKNSVDSGVRAYCAVGPSLYAMKTMYSMDISIPVEDLKLYADIPKLLIDKTSEAGLTSVKIMARES